MASKTIKLIQKSFKQINSNPVIPLFFVIYLILLTLALPYIATISNRILGLILITCIFLLSAVFFAGWMSMFNEALKEEDKKSLPGIFFEGAGKNIVSSILLLLFYSVLLMVFSLIAAKISLRYFGDPSLLMQNIPRTTPEAYVDYVNNLTSDQLYMIYGWMFTPVLLFAFFSFFFMYIPASFVKLECKNIFLKPFLTIWDSFKFIFKNFGYSIKIYLIICLSIIIMHIISAIASISHILSLVNLFIYIYFISYVIMLIFNCYDYKNSNSDGSDSVGENGSDDKTCEEV